MNPNSYFEEAPWARLASEVRDGSVGKVVAIAAQATCAPDQITHALHTWRTRFESLLGPALDAHLLENPQARSLLLRYDGPVIGRIFIDACGGPPSSNVEIVGTDGLLVWKPDVHPLAFITTDAGAELAIEHAYPTALQEGQL